MPDIYGPFDSSPWAQTDWYRYAPTWAPSGVVGSAAAATSASAGPFGLTVSGLNITLALGRAWVYGAGYERTSTPWTATVPTNTNSNPRIDALVLRRDLAAKTVLPVILQGTPAASPVAPTRSSDELGQWDLPLFSWTTPGSSGSPITAVSDQRVWVDTQGTNYAVASAGGGQMKAYGSMTGSQAASSTNSRILGGLNVAPPLLPGRLYEVEWIGSIAVPAGSAVEASVRVIAGASSPTNSTGTVVAGGSWPSTGTVPTPFVLGGKFTGGTVGTYTVSPFLFTAGSGSVSAMSPQPAMTLVIRDMGPSVGVVGTTPIAVP